MISPHGSKELKVLLLEGREKEEELKKAETLPKLELSSRETGDLIMMGIGGYTPLEGFMGQDDWKGVCEAMKMTNGIFWPIPITMSQDEKVAAGTEVALVSGDTNEIMGTMKVSESYKIDKGLECKNVFTTNDAEHPGVKMVMEQKEWNVAGTVRVLSESYFPTEFQGIYQRPAESRKIFEEKGWKTIAALQLRNPMHRSHEYLAKIAIEVSDGLYIHQLVGKLKPGDIPADVRVKCINTLVEYYFDKNRVVMGGYPLDMRYGGPREGLLHGVFRQNFGCTHMTLGATTPALVTTTGPSMRRMPTTSCGKVPSSARCCPSIGRSSATSATAWLR
jgi:sulfate adenylyltransferase